MTFKHKITGTQAKLDEDGKYYIHNCSIGIPKQFIEDSKVWVKEDGYEILIFKSNRLNFYMPAIQKDGTYLDNPVMSCDGEGAPLDWMLKESEYYIHSIKRLSDGEVFTLGDKVSERLSDKKEFIIESFNVYHDRLVIGIKKKSTHTTVGFRFLDKVKESTIITEDGVELFKGDEYHTIYVMDDNRYNTWTTQKKPFIIDASKNAYVHDGVKYFAKKENAEKYIKENKPQYSLNDIRKVLTKEMKCSHWAMIDVDKVIKDLEND